MEFLFSYDKFLQEKILLRSLLPSTPSPLQPKNPPEKVCTLPNNHHSM